jgi:hypothetical protein
VLYLGLSARLLEGEDAIEVGVAVHDTSFALDFCVHKVPVESNAQKRESTLIRHCIDVIKGFSSEHRVKFVGAGIGKPLHDFAPALCSALWRELDIIPLVLSVYLHEHGTTTPTPPTADEQADSVVRKAMVAFGPQHLPRVQIGFRNLVGVDEDGLIRIVDGLNDFRKSVREPTWNACLKMATEIKRMGTRIAFFSSTPQGGGVGIPFTSTSDVSVNAACFNSIVQGPWR